MIEIRAFPKRHKVNGFTCQRIYWGVTSGRLLFIALVDCAALGFDQLAVVLAGGFSFGHGVGIVCPCLRLGRPFRGLLHLIIGTLNSPLYPCGLSFIGISTVTGKGLFSFVAFLLCPVLRF